ncbi:hypothetical protein [Pseudomonas umsongensis]|uniref:hypothetical protein n=1 Tax=Pseudomonas umsongensis TaxID=198618 RepID=UPI003ECC45DE
MIKKMPVALLILFVSLSGCAKDYSLAPPPDSEQMTITVKVPKELVARPMLVMYRSATCKRITHGASGERIELEGYHGIEVQLQRQGQSYLHSTKLPMEVAVLVDGNWPMSPLASLTTFRIPLARMSLMARGVG